MSTPVSRGTASIVGKFALVKKYGVRRTDQEAPNVFRVIYTASKLVWLAKIIDPNLHRPQRKIDQNPTSLQRPLGIEKHSHTAPSVSPNTSSIGNSDCGGPPHIRACAQCALPHWVERTQPGAAAASWSFVDGALSSVPLSSEIPALKHLQRPCVTGPMG
jgi:hypothetical protein